MRALGRLLGRHRPAVVVPSAKGDRLGLSCELWVEVYDVFWRRWALFRWIFQPVARACAVGLRQAGCSFPDRAERTSKQEGAPELERAAGAPSCVINEESVPVIHSSLGAPSLQQASRKTAAISSARPPAREAGAGCPAALRCGRSCRRSARSGGPPRRRLPSWQRWGCSPCAHPS